MEDYQLTGIEADITAAYDMYSLLFTVFIVAIAVWEIASRLRRKDISWRYVVDSVSSILTLPAIVGMSYLTTAIGIGSVFSLAYIVHENYAIYPLDWSWWNVLLVLIVADFWYYWEHRAFHRVNCMWTTHTVHHSSDYINIPMAYRFGPLDSFFSSAIHIPLALFFEPTLLGMTIVADQIYQAWIHTDRIKKMPVWFEAVMNTPSHHRVHHGRNPQYIDKNYAGILIIWDKMFGTFEPEVETVEYGITKPLKYQDPITVLFHGFWRFLLKLTTARSIKEVWCCFFMPPGWQTNIEISRQAALEGLPVSSQLDGKQEQGVQV